MSQRVLHLLWDGALGGVQRYVKHLVLADLWKDTEHHVCFLQTAGEVFGPSDIDGTRVHQLGITKGWQLKRARQLQHVVAQVGPSVIHCHCDTPAFMTQLQKIRHHAPVIYHEHGDTLMRTYNVMTQKVVWHLFGRHWDYVVANSQVVREDLIFRYPWLAPKSKVFHNPLLEQSDTKEFTKPERPTIGVFARMVYKKGVDRSIPVIARIKKAIPEAELVIYGTGPDEPEIRQQVANLGLSESVQFRGYVPDPLEHMGRLHCLIVPSRTEPFGLVALEAQSVSVPVVGFAGSGVAEIVEHQTTGLIVPENDLEAMADAAMTILKNHKLAEEMGQAAYWRARNNFSLEKHISDLEQLYVELAKQPACHYS